CVRCALFARHGCRILSMTDEKAPTPEEEREAQALARALDGEDAQAPADALEAAALLRASRDSELSDVHARAIREQIIPRPRRGHWAMPLGALAAVAATVTVLVLARRQSPTPIPTPSPMLLAAQAEAARPHGGHELDREMVG